MKLGYQTNTWGGVVGHPAGVTSVKDLYYLANGSTEQAARDIASAGYKGIELFDGNLAEYENRQDDFRRMMADLQLTLVGVYTGANFIFRDILDEEFAKIEKVAKLASEFGAEHLVFGGGAVRSGGIQESDYEVLAQSLTRAEEIAVKYGLTPSYHPHLGTCVQAPEQLDKLMSMTTIALCPDTAHIEAGGGNPVTVMRKYIDRIKYVHFKDYKDGQFLPLGEGDQNFAEMLSILQGANYDGWVLVELDSHQDPLQAAQISKSYLQDTLNLA
ncbi:sugar phosphate isomerase/epimerase family protein [Paenibacillus xerothermodurans]|uniref:Sugar phosphate isomerase/epimerase n=1 Tax=Paenibacillus xerothermodurans TaxID=1977292 RepID=A0A2W1NLI7_PAEXE|nr:sugar phosphate isomerase/epimerase family protein [Paenibacillus xerothermodurans]PZE19873.1 sugar phosphate isomerase/epimerase [Paenibacillus xerothermodurans]